MKIFLLLCVVSSILADMQDTVYMKDVVGENPVNAASSGSLLILTAKTEYSEQELKTCNDMLGKFIDGVVVRPPTNFNLEKILEDVGGPAGQVNASRRSDVPEAPIKDPKQRPLSLEGPQYWLYSYNATDYKTYLRAEYAVKRFAGTPKEFTEVRGVVGWIHPEFCGQLRVASYRLDDTGFHATLDPRACRLLEEPKPIITCKYPPRCETKDGKLHCKN